MKLRKKTINLFFIYFLLFLNFFLFSCGNLIKKNEFKSNNSNKNYIDYFTYKDKLLNNKRNIEKEPNNNFNQANELINIENIYGKINSKDDIDIFYFKNESLSEIKNFLMILNESGFCNLILEVYNSDKKLILKSKQNKNIYIKLHPGENIYIKIYSENSKNLEKILDFNNLIYTYNLVFLYEKSNNFFEVEPNDNFSKSNEIFLNNIFKGTSKDNDIDIFNFEFEKAKFINIFFKVEVGFGNLEVIDENENIIYKKEKLKIGGNLFPILFEKGKYYLKIYGNNLQYEISISETSFTGEIEFNDNFEDANMLVSNHNTTGMLSFENDIDIFYFNNKNSNEIYISFSFDGNDVVYINIYDENNKLIYEFRVNENEISKKIYLNKGIYFVKIFRENKNSEIFYNLKVNYK